MNIKHVVDEFIKVGLAEDLDQNERKRVLCELLLVKLKNMTVEELHSHFESMHLYKKDQRVVLTLSFPITFNEPS